MAHQLWDEQLKRMSQRGGSPGMLAEVLIRVALADGPVPRSAISKGGMLSARRTLPWHGREGGRRPDR